jgi:hypothetical protein
MRLSQFAGVNDSKVRLGRSHCQTPTKLADYQDARLPVKENLPVSH